MSNKPVILPPQKTRKHSVDEINRAMARFPLILQILGEVGSTQFPLPGDEDIRHGCERALTRMLSELARIPAAPDDSSSGPESTAQAWLQEAAARQYIDADKLERMQQFIDGILSPSKR